MRSLELWERFAFVYHCVGCGQLLSYEQSKSAFCEKCRAVYEEAKTVGCPTCPQEIAACTCMPKALSKSGALCLRKRVCYDKTKAHLPQNRLLYRLKHHPNARLERFVAKEIALAVREELRVLSLDDPSEDAVLSFVPRSRGARRVEGFDHAERITRALSAELGIPMRRAIERTRGGRVQKNLTASERIQNAKQSLRLSEQADVNGKYVLLFDDVVTTGAGMSACTALLRKAGARGVLCFCFAID